MAARCSEIHTSAMHDQTLSVELAQGTIRYRDVGQGPVLLFVHGLLVSGTVWRKVLPRLSQRYRCIVPDWPLGSHQTPMHPDADLSPAGVARIVADFMEALGLSEVTLIGNDSGGAICQLVVTDDSHRARVARLVLTTCDAFEIFPPPLFNYLKWVVRVPGVMQLLAWGMLGAPPLRRLPIAYGLLTKRPIDHEVLEAWIRPGAASAGVRRDVAKFIRGVSPAVTMEVARRLPSVRMPALVVWTPEDRSFPLSLGERLADALPEARLELVPDALVFVSEDRPEALADAIERFVPNGDRAAVAPNGPTASV
jgi:pimeloyl-ACP methyl ester carboxylesterase